MAVVTESLVQLIAKQVDEKGLVVWYDPELRRSGKLTHRCSPKVTQAF